VSHEKIEGHIDVIFSLIEGLLHDGMEARKDINRLMEHEQDTHAMAIAALETLDKSQKKTQKFLLNLKEGMRESQKKNENNKGTINNNEE
jgi:hypothetical protein